MQNNLYKLSEKQRGKICELLNPPDSNYKSINWIKCLEKVNSGYRFEVGYWITYLGCRPKYNKDIVFISDEKLAEFNK